ncbi:hypothetical protein [Streptacidiphilus fuscans]|uniref:Uncharacterized protein n=1 Tax=Streptacidiphilus fuscans TaxID=2789292 RepID=A0A931B7E5_9ACTN|nr:hypothetical protein [Streptacidiphilus fuscans]MBF9071799.1 hypothetical protein [Streptacidiphilus fuscans]
MLALGSRVADAADLPSLRLRPVLDLPTVTADLAVVLDLAGRAGDAVIELTRRIPSTPALPQLLTAIATGAHVTELLTTAGAHLSRVAATFATPARERSEDDTPVGVHTALARDCLQDCATLLTIQHDRPTAPDRQQSSAAVRRSPALPPTSVHYQSATAAVSERSAAVLPFRRRP